MNCSVGMEARRSSCDISVMWLNSVLAHGSDSGVMMGVTYGIARKGPSCKMHFTPSGGMVGISRV